MQKVITALVLSIASTPVSASFGNWKLCDNVIECAALATIFFAAAGVPLAAILAWFIYGRIQHGMARGQRIKKSLLAGSVAYVVAIFVTTVLDAIAPVPYRYEEEFRFGAFFVLLPVFVFVACRKLRPR